MKNPAIVGNRILPKECALLQVWTIAQFALVFLFQGAQ